jgi:hypothetical protein
MLDKVIKTIADAIAAAVAREVAKQIPVVAETVAVAVADRILKEFGIAPLSDEFRAGLHAAADAATDITEGVIGEARKRFGSLIPAFLR